MTKFFCKTFGCKVNQCETEYLSSLLEEKGFLRVSKLEEADIVIVNSCIVTNKAGKKVISFLRAIPSEKKKVVIGCMTRSYQKEKLVKYADIIITKEEIEKIAMNLWEVLGNKLSVEIKKELYIKKFHSHTRAFVKIQSGCNAFCAYCIIPFVRRHITFVPENQVIQQVKLLVKNGYKEIVLTGTHLGYYNRENRLVKLIDNLTNIEGLERIRLSSIELKELTSELVALIKNNSKICPHLAIPLQSGSNRILKLMNRKYSVEEYIEVIEKLKGTIKNLCITTDVIIGFPTETSKDFEQTLYIIEKCKFLKVHLFPYSEHKNTRASSYFPKVKESEKKYRMKIAIDYVYDIRKKVMKNFVNHKLSLLIERIYPSVSGFCENYIPLYIPPSELKNVKPGDIVDVIVKEKYLEN